MGGITDGEAAIGDDAGEDGVIGVVGVRFNEDGAIARSKVNVVDESDFTRGAVGAEEKR